MTQAVDRAREHKLPTLIEARTYRYMGHSMADPIHGHYRTKEELEEQKGRDPVAALQHRLEQADLLPAAALAAMRQGVEDEVDDAIRFAEESPEPAPAELHTDVYQG
jgi:pyruvate dehydrogenase E1 component alpha subunit